MGNIFNIGNTSNKDLELVDLSATQAAVKEVLDLSEAQRKARIRSCTVLQPTNNRDQADIFGPNRGLRFERLPAELAWQILRDVPFDRALNAVTDEPSQYNDYLKGNGHHQKYVGANTSNGELVKLRDLFRFIWRTTPLLLHPWDHSLPELQPGGKACLESTDPTPWDADQLLPEDFHTILLSAGKIKVHTVDFKQAIRMKSQAQIFKNYEAEFIHLQRFIRRQYACDEVVWYSKNSLYRDLAPYLNEQISSMLIRRVEEAGSGTDLHLEDYENYRSLVLQVVSSLSFQEETYKKIEDLLDRFSNRRRPEGPLDRMFDRIDPWRQSYCDKDFQSLQMRQRDYVEKHRDAPVDVGFVLRSATRSATRSLDSNDFQRAVRLGAPLDASIINISFPRRHAMAIEACYEATRMALGQWYERRARELFRELCPDSLHGVTNYLTARSVVSKQISHNGPVKLEIHKNCEADVNWGSFDNLAHAQQRYWWHRLQHGLCRVKCQQLNRLADIMDAFPHMTMMKKGLDEAETARANYAHITDRIRTVARKVDTCKVESWYVRSRHSELFRFYGLPVQALDRDLQFFVDVLIKHPPNTTATSNSSSQDSSVAFATDQNASVDDGVLARDEPIATSLKRVLRETGYNVILSSQKYTYSREISDLIVTALNGLSEVFRTGSLKSLSRVELDENQQQLRFKNARANVVLRPRYWATESDFLNIDNGRLPLWCYPLDDRDIDWLEAFLKAVVWMRQTWTPTEVIQPVIERGHDKPSLLSEDALRHSP